MSNSPLIDSTTTRVSAWNGTKSAAHVALVNPATGTPFTGFPITEADGSNVTLGAKADTAATWYTDAVSLISLIKLAIAAFVDAGTHAYGYTSGQLTTDAWTLFGSTRTKTYTYTTGVLTAESDWV